MWCREGGARGLRNGLIKLPDSCGGCGRPHFAVREKTIGRGIDKSAWRTPVGADVMMRKVSEIQSRFPKQAITISSPAAENPPILTRW